MNVPHPGSEAWTRALGYEVEDYWRAWLVDEQVSLARLGRFNSPIPTPFPLIHCIYLSAVQLNH